MNGSLSQGLIEQPVFPGAEVVFWHPVGSLTVVVVGTGLSAGAHALLVHQIMSISA